ncbi:MAG: hypothetical protein KF757_07560 [Phycisphaeraceae bacterium]|nr:hypothetical protein [Phycisphaeraceae bacterium]MCW5762613.1 hypothetical protein [Phycisphaeraceae bacterium]
MKAMWNTLAILALSNVLAIAGFVGWLVSSDRLNMDRARTIRAMLTETAAEQAAREKAEKDRQTLLEAQADEGPTGPARSASELVAMRLQATEIDVLRIERLRREIEDLQRKLARDQQVMDVQGAQFMQDRQQFEAMRARIREIEGNEQFRKAVVALETQKASDAREILSELLNEGAVEQVVSYLNAMDERVRSRVLAEFVKGGQPDLAAQLLESLRTRGLEAAAVGETLNE